ncbi:nuclear transport factor 2 family protein [Leptospira licerasiae]|uniref:SnoaL-like domain protein n=1 Tax=Leptospira licerasiae str. MMD4847 TaxID=1049971 RepID=A0ABN0H6L8_9LEPT|nr:nuclear transport factor 2 family protein [Leptospira licerasiae]EIE00693.1 SnoaL-like domain protein [Leptospira licerasiae serovar Varillal str. VAR 010]EJZ41229.1 SnoaL-like domain protein [Leptospira licerasiae str. MMD4847]
MKKLAALSLAVVSLLSCGNFAQEEKNKKLVLDYFKNALVDRKYREAADLYLSDDYRQHNPSIGTGKEAFKEAFDGFFKHMPDTSFEIKRALVDGNMVVVHSHLKLDKTSRGLAVVDIFRVEKDKIVEHWDVIQEIPENPKNENTMF